MTNQTNLITINNGRAITNSLTVASVFNKRHDNILSKISKLNKGVKGLLKKQESYFTASTYLNEQNKEQPCYNISRDGFVLLTMGFTGKKALEFKNLLTRIVKWGNIIITKTAGSCCLCNLGNFFMSFLWRTITPNILNKCKCPVALVESSTNSYFGGITKTTQEV